MDLLMKSFAKCIGGAPLLLQGNSAVLKYNLRPVFKCN